MGSIYSLMKFISRSSHGKLMGREQSVKTLWYNGLLVGYRLTVYRIQVISTTYIIYPLDSFLLPNFLVVGGQHHKSPRYQAFFFLNYEIKMWEILGYCFTYAFAPRLSHADKQLNRTFLLPTTVRRISRIFKGERLLYHELPWRHRWRPTGLPCRTWTHILWSVATCFIQLD